MNVIIPLKEMDQEKRNNFSALFLPVAKKSQRLTSKEKNGKDSPIFKPNRMKEGEAGHIHFFFRELKNRSELQGENPSTLDPIYRHGSSNKILLPKGEKGQDVKINNLSSPAPTSPKQAGN